MNTLSTSSTREVAVRSAADRMPPPPPREAIVMDEDEWTLELERLIERDYFPDIPHMATKLAWLEAKRTGDTAKLDEVLANLRNRACTGATTSGRGGGDFAPSPAFTPSGDPGSSVAGTPVSNDWGGGGGVTPSDVSHADTHKCAAVQPVAPSHHSLDSFLAGHTSEDNASFNSLLHKSNQAKKAKQAWVHQQGAKKPSSSELLEGADKADGFGTSGQTTFTLEYRMDEPKNQLYYDSAYQPSCALTSSEIAERAAGPPKQIRAPNTRLTSQDLVAASTPTTPASSSSLASTPTRTTVRGGYSLVSSPSPNPGAAGEDSPFITWGQLGSTPLRLEGEGLEEPRGPSFTINQETVREKMNRKLAQSAGASLKARGVVGSTRASPSPSPSGVRGGSSLRSPLVGKSGQGLSQAALRLVSQVRERAGNSMDSQLRQSYAHTPTRGAHKSTPSQMTPGSKNLQSTPGSTPIKGHVSRSHVRTPVSDHAHQSHKRPRISEQGSAGKASITDNLLNL